MKIAIVGTGIAGNFAAWGMLCTDLKHDYAQTCVVPLAEADFQTLASRYAELEAEARDTLAQERVPADQVLVTRALALRYLGQGHALESTGPAILRAGIVIPVAHGFSGKRGACIVPESKARRQVIANLYCAEPQRGYRVREACIAAENPCVPGIH